MTKTDTCYLAAILCTIAVCVLIIKLQSYHADVVEYRAEVAELRTQFEKVLPRGGGR